MTLPLIHALQQAEKKDKRHIIHTVRTNNNDPRKIREVIDFVKQAGGIDFAEKRCFVTGKM